MIDVLNRFTGVTATVDFMFFIGATQAAAQEQDTDTDEEREVLEEIVVTGHIGGVRMDGLLPVDVMSSDDVDTIAAD